MEKTKKAGYTHTDSHIRIRLKENLIKRELKPLWADKTLRKKKLPTYQHGKNSSYEEMGTLTHCWWECKNSTVPTEGNIVRFRGRIHTFNSKILFSRTLIQRLLVKTQKYKIHAGWHCGFIINNNKRLEIIQRDINGYTKNGGRSLHMDRRSNLWDIFFSENSKVQNSTCNKTSPL